MAHDPDRVLPVRHRQQGRERPLAAVAIEVHRGRENTADRPPRQPANRARRTQVCGPACQPRRVGVERAQQADQRGQIPEDTPATRGAVTPITAVYCRYAPSARQRFRSSLSSAGLRLC
jgi:hypothetical protein